MHPRTRQVITTKAGTMINCPCNKGEPHVSHCGLCKAPLKDRAHVESHNCGIRFVERRAELQHAQDRVMRELKR